MTALGMENKGWIQEDRSSKCCRGKESTFSLVMFNLLAACIHLVY